MTPVEYLEREQNADSKSEFIGGKIIPMAGATANHNRISLNFCRLFPLESSGKIYEVFMSDMRLWVPSHQSYTYPDVMVVAGDPQFTDHKQTAITNPCLIAEVLSSSTENYDKTAKFQLYRSIPEFAEYLLIDQTTYRVEQYVKTGDRQWLLTEHLGEAAAFSLTSSAIAIDMKDLYKRVNFEPTLDASESIG